MVREISLLRDTQDMANFRIPREMEERRCGLRLLPKRSLSKTSQFGAGEPDPGSGKVVGEGPQGVRTVSPLRHQVFKVFRSSRERERGQDPYWDPGSEESKPDFRVFGGGGGGTLASLLMGSGGAI